MWQNSWVEYHRAPAGMDVALFGFDARVPHGGLNTHTLSRINSDCSLANNFIHSFLSDSFFLRLFLDFSWAGIWMESMCFGVPGTLPGADLGDFGCDARTGDRVVLKHTH